MKESRLSLILYLARPTFDLEQTASLQRTLLAQLPAWSARMKVTKTEHQRRGVYTEADADLSSAIEQAAPPRFGHGHAVVRGATDGVVLFLESSRSTLPPEGNCISVEVTASAIEGHPATAWAMNFFEGIARALPVRYARAHLADEFDAKNILHEGDATRAVGMNLRRGLPGLYWLNYFGEPYVRLIDKQRLLECPAPTVEDLGSGVLVALGKEPAAWSTTAYKQAEDRVLNHIGRDYFLDKSAPDRLAAAPEFRAGHGTTS